MLFLQEGLWSLIRLKSFPNPYFSTCLVMSSVVQLVSDFVFTPYVLRQRHGVKLNPPPMWYWWCARWAACSFPLRQSPRNFSPQEICTSVSPIIPQQQEPTMCLLSWTRTIHNKLYFPLHLLIALYEQASSPTSWLKAFFVNIVNLVMAGGAAEVLLLSLSRPLPLLRIHPQSYNRLLLILNQGIE